MVRAGVLTISDKGSRGERVDESGEVIRDLLEREGVEVTRYDIVPDEYEKIRLFLIEWSDKAKLDLIFTTGGTGLSSRDVTPEATASILERTAPGISEAIRAEGMKKTIRAMLSRGTAGVRSKTLIVNLPGSPKAVRESIETILPALFHGLEVLQGGAVECSSKMVKT
jgi:molybdenum cofactor synthesis domain-containing protein